MTASAALPRLHVVQTYVRSLAAAQDFWARHFGLQPVEGQGLSYAIPAIGGGAVSWRLLPGAEPCGTRGPHGALPAFQVADFGQARGYLLAQGIPIVFEEILPGISLLIFLDADANPIELVQPTDPSAWDIAERRLLRTKARRDLAPSGPLSLGPLYEITLYTHDITNSVQFYRDLVGLPAGLSFFGHMHLVAANLPVVLRGVNWRCKAPQQRHGSELTFAAPDLPALAARVQAAGYAPTWTAAAGVTCSDPAGQRLHFAQQGQAGQRRGSM